MFKGVKGKGISRMKEIKAVFTKQIKDTLKNKTVLLQFVMFPVLVVIMEHSVHMEGMQEHFFVMMFGSMYVGMAPLTCAAAIISEEKETGTLGMLLISNVKAWEYLIGIGTYIFLACMAGALCFAFTGEYEGWQFGAFLLFLASGIMISMLVGAVIGLICKNQMSATSVTVPVMMIFSFLPMISMFNQKVQEVSKFIYSWQVQNLIGALGGAKEASQLISAESLGVLAANLLIAAVLFGCAYKKVLK